MPCGQIRSSQYGKLGSKSGVYQIRNIIDGKIYIGSAIHFRLRWQGHVKALRKGYHHSIYLQRAWNKYGEENFVFEILLVCEPTKEELLYYEQAALDSYKSYDFHIGYNSVKTAKNALGYQHRDESKLKMSESAKKNKAERSKRMKDYWNMRRASGDTSNQTPESKRKIGEAARKPKGPMPEEQKQRLRDFYKDPKVLANHKEKIRQTQDDPAYREKHRQGVIRNWKFRKANKLLASLVIQPNQGV